MSVLINAINHISEFKQEPLGQRNLMYDLNQL